MFFSVLGGAARIIEEIITSIRFIAAANGLYVGELFGKNMFYLLIE